MAHLTSIFVFLCLAITSSEGQFSSDAEVLSGAEVVSVCSLPKVVGPCRAAFKRFFFNSATGQCEEFTYGGCEGNDNNFSTQDLCDAACPPTNVCDLPKIVGLCKARLPRFYFSSVSGMCEEFFYGGCGANGNNFMSLEECNGQCPPTNVCDQPKVVGPCRALIPRYFYNKVSKNCEAFRYGGCQGNGNNFERLEDCTKQCQPVNACDQPKVTGPCRAAFPRYYYNARTKTCERFTYGGCQGNENNFESESACKRSCQANSSSFWTYSFGNLF